MGSLAAQAMLSRTRRSYDPGVAGVVTLVSNVPLRFSGSRTVTFDQKQLHFSREG